MSDLPLIGITMGDPAGIGPEIIVEAFKEEALFDACRPVILGDPGILETAASTGHSHRDIVIVASPLEALNVRDRIPLLPVSHLAMGEVSPGRPSIEGAKAMVQYILRGVALAVEGKIEALVTAPMNKARMQEAGYPFEGHTQLIAHLTGAKDYVMMLAGERLRVALVTIHCPLKDVPSLLTSKKIERTIRITAEALRGDFGYERPRLAVAGLNPHAGEEGLFGSEEEEIISPAVERVRQAGYEVVGPLAADTLFWKAASGQFDAVIAMYHDQGLIPLKLLHFSDAVNLTLGIPIIRTSVDHGTAYDIAGKGVADASSLKAAVRMAATMAAKRKRGRKGP